MQRASLGKQIIPLSPSLFLTRLAYLYHIYLYSLGPYLAFRRLNTEVTSEDATGSRGVFESKLPALGMLGFAFLLTGFVITQGGFSQQISDFLELFQTQRLVHVSTIDFAILSLALYDPITEDIARRYISSDTGKEPSALRYCAVPVLGPILYLLSRPSLPSSEES